MRRLRRESLESDAAALLLDRTRRIEAAGAPYSAQEQRTAAQKEEAARLWKNEGTRAFEQVRDALRAMAPPTERCMYCENSEGSDVEHFRPRSSYPMSSYDWENLLWACAACNSNHKRSRFPCDPLGAPLLIDPTAEDPREHITLLPRSGELEPLSQKGEHSIDVFGLGRRALVEGRRDAWVAVQVHLKEYAAACALHDGRRALNAQRVLCRHPFASVLSHLLAILEGPSAEDLVELGLLDPACRRAVRAHPEICDWP
jgi:uncharacterized protein (TIGR02646 family)